MQGVGSKASMSLLMIQSFGLRERALLGVSGAV